MFCGVRESVLRRLGECFLCGEDFDSEYRSIDFSKLTLFIVGQGTGKTAVAKLFSLCSWLEKAFFSW